MRKGRFAVVLFLVALVAVVAVLSWMLARGFSARDKPNAAEALVVRRLRHLAVPRGAREGRARRRTQSRRPPKSLRKPGLILPTIAPSAIVTTAAARPRS